MQTMNHLFIFLLFCAVNQGTTTKQYLHLAKIYEGEASPQKLSEQVSIQRCLTSAGKQGYCVPVRSCAIDTDSNILKILDQLCVTKQGTIGLCCSADLLERQSYYEPQVSTQTASSETNEALKERGCGLTTKEFPKIVQGRAAEPDEWPWMAAIIRQHSPIVHCGAVLITHQHVLTAAHCTYLEDKNNLYVRLGEYDFGVMNETRSREFRILRIVQHVDFDATTYENDIALLQLDRPTLFNTYIWPACLPPFNENWESWVGVVIGWGTKFFGGPYSKVLMEVSIPIWHKEACQNGIIERINEKHMCAGEKTGGKDSCQGDSGGPLLIQLENKRWVVAGIVSWGIRCGEPNHPGVYTKVNEFTHWITSNL